MTTSVMWTLALIAVVSILWIAMVAAVAFVVRAGVAKSGQTRRL
ncbi:MAG TPA: hypothetical protein VKP14_01940 [Gaiellaceae bacterium]|nr:hypothetical protein [Gaiellaceae bacterium]